MKCVIICVNYADILQQTLPYNEHHFNEILVVTAPEDELTPVIAKDHNVLITDEFYRRNAIFNKWSALEKGLDVIGRSGPMCILDADIALPKEATLEATSGKLCIPIRRMAPLGELPPEKEWGQFPLDAFQGWAGYCMFFHCGDPVLLKRPWFPGWIHAGGADTEFEQRWRREHKKRTSFEVLHIGEPRTNWCGRKESDKKMLQHIMRERQYGGLHQERLGGGPISEQHTLRSNDYGTKKTTDNQKIN